MQPIDHLVAAALRGDSAEVTARLRADPALMQARNMFGAGVVHAAWYGSHPELLALPAFARWEPDVITSAELGDVTAVRHAITADPGLATAFSGATTVLHAACYWGQPDVARLLLEAGAGVLVSEPSRDGVLQVTPLGAAVASTPGIPQPSDDEAVVLALVRLLLAHGADVNARRRDGLTALHTAAWRGHAVVAAELLEAGADAAAAATAGAHRGEIPADTALAQGHLVLAAQLDPAVR